jgi:hypothetical protein
MRRFLTLLALLCGAALAQNFPASLDTDQTLLNAYDRGDVTLSAAVGATDLTLPVVDGSSIAGATYFSGTVENERILICSVSGNTLTVCSGGRGYSGSTAAAHPISSHVKLNYTAKHHNALKDAMKAVQAALGVSLANVLKTSQADTAGSANSIAQRDGAGQINAPQFNGAFYGPWSAAGVTDAGGSIQGTRPTLSAQFTGSTTKARFLSSAVDWSALTQNAYYNGTNWIRDDVALGGSLIHLGTTGGSIRTFPAGANPAVQNNAISWDTAGKVTFPLPEVTIANAASNGLTVAGDHPTITLQYGTAVAKGRISSDSVTGSPKLTFNSYFDTQSGVWMRDDTSVGGGRLTVLPTGGTLHAYPAGANPVGAAEHLVFQWDVLGNLTGLNVAQDSYAQITTTSPAGGGFLYRGQRGTIAAPTAAVSGDTIGIYGGSGYHSGGAFSGTAAMVRMYAAENFTATAQGSLLVFETTPIGSPSTGRLERMRIDSAGKVGLGLSPSYQLQLSTDSAAKPTTSAWTVASDSRFKTNIRPFADGLDILRQIHPVAYELNGKGGLPAGVTGISVIAQDVATLLPYAVGTYRAKLNPEDDSDTELYNFNSGPLTFVMVNAIKDLESQTLQRMDVTEAVDACALSLRGQARFVQDDAAGDQVKICGRAADGTFAWKAVVRY